MSRTKTDRIDIVNGPMIPNIFRFILPLIATSVLQLLYNAADNVVVGRYASYVALAAVGSTGALINLILNVCIGLSVGSSVAVAQDYGAGDEEGVQKVIHTSVYVSAVGGLIVGVIGFFFSRQFLVWMGSPEDVLPLATLYLKIYFLGTPASMIYNFCASILRSVGDTKHPLYYLTISGIINVIFNLIFVIQFHLGVAGVAIATVISQYVSCVMVVVFMMRAQDCCHLDLRKLKIHGDKFKKIVRVGLPAGLQGSVFSISNVVIQSAINSFNSVVMAGCTAAGQIEGFVYVAQNSLYQAALTFTGQYIGAGKLDKIRKVCFNCMWIVTAIGLILGILACVFGRPLLSIYIPDEPAAIEYGIERLLIVALPYFLCGWMEVLVGCQRGMGMSITPMIVSMLGACGLRILWISTIFQTNRTLFMLFLSYPLSWFITASVHFVFYKIHYAKLLKRHAVDESVQA